MSNPLHMHGTCVAVDGRGALFCGPSGSGKSDIALRLIERGAQLVADDQVILAPLDDGKVEARSEPRLEGRLEVRGIGILKVPFAANAPLLAIFELVMPDQVPRLPETEWAEPLPGHKIRRFSLAPFEASAPDKVRLTLGALAQL